MEWKKPIYWLGRRRPYWNREARSQESRSIIETNEITRQKAVIESVTSGFVNDFNIVNNGNDYKVNDILTFDNEGTDGSGLISKISSIEGKDVVNIETSVENYPTATFTWQDESKVKVTILPDWI